MWEELFFNNILLFTSFVSKSSAAKSAFTFNELLFLTKYLACYRFGTFGALVEYGAEKKVSQNSSVSAAVMVGVPTGVVLKLK